VDFQLKQMLEILKLRLSKRGADLVPGGHMSRPPPLAAASRMVSAGVDQRRQEDLTPREGLEAEGAGEPR
jgi:hypothetical protein